MEQSKEWKEWKKELDEIAVQILTHSITSMKKSTVQLLGLFTLVVVCTHNTELVRVVQGRE